MYSIVEAMTQFRRKLDLTRARRAFFGRPPCFSSARSAMFHANKTSSSGRQPLVRRFRRF